MGFAAVRLGSMLGPDGEEAEHGRRGGFCVYHARSFNYAEDIASVAKNGCGECSGSIGVVSDLATCPAPAVVVEDSVDVEGVIVDSSTAPYIYDERNLAPLNLKKTHCFDEHLEQLTHIVNKRRRSH